MNDQELAEYLAIETGKVLQEVFAKNNSALTPLELEIGRAHV